MTGIAGILGLETGDDVMINTVGQRIVYDAANQYLAMANEDMTKAFSVFVEGETEDYKERYKLPGGGYLQRRGNLTTTAATRAVSGWDVGFPLEDFGAQIAGDFVEMAYMTVQELQRQIDNVRIQNLNTWRFEILKRLFKNTQTVFTDPRKGTINVEGLANGDSALYPPVLGTATEATENHYIETGYITSAISSTNNPLTTVRNELEEHFGAPSGYGNVALFVNPTAVPYLEALADYDRVEDMNLRLGSDKDVPINMPTVPGRVVGRGYGAWVIEWRWVPDNYMLGLDLDIPGPLKIRRDPASTGLPRGLTLVAEDEEFPFRRSHYVHRFGVGVGNRLNGVVLELANGGAYTIPTAYQ